MILISCGLLESLLYPTLPTYGVVDLTFELSLYAITEWCFDPHHAEWSPKYPNIQSAYMTSVLARGGPVPIRSSHAHDGSVGRAHCIHSTGKHPQPREGRCPPKPPPNAACYTPHYSWGFGRYIHVRPAPNLQGRPRYTSSAQARGLSKCWSHRPLGPLGSSSSQQELVL